MTDLYLAITDELLTLADVVYSAANITCTLPLLEMTARLHSGLSLMSRLRQQSIFHCIPLVEMLKL